MIDFVPSYICKPVFYALRKIPASTCVLAVITFQLSVGLTSQNGWAESTPPSILPQRQTVPLSPRTPLGRKNLQYEYDLHPANVFRHLESVEKRERSFKLKRRIKIFRDTTIFEDDV